MNRTSDFRELVNFRSFKSGWLFTLHRFIIRYPVRLFGIRLGIYYLNLTYKITRFSKLYGDLYLVNLYHLKSFSLLIGKEYLNYLENKRKLLNYILQYGQNKDDKFIAKYYLELLNINGLPQITGFELTGAINFSDIYYIYGPNAKSFPNGKFIDSKLILTKFPNFEVSDFSSVDLYLNSHTFDQLSPDENNLLLKKFNVIIKSRSTDERLYQLDSLPDSEIASCLGLNRILWHLYRKFGSSVNSVYLKIEGFDLYTEKISYSGNIYSTILNKSLNVQDEILIKGLWQHDLIFNFLDLKNVISKFKLIESDEFIKMINMSLTDYWKTVTKNRIK
jgi:hypothetical protein